MQLVLLAFLFILLPCVKNLQKILKWLLTETVSFAAIQWQRRQRRHTHPHKESQSRQRGSMDRSLFYSRVCALSAQQPIRFTAAMHAAGFFGAARLCLSHKIFQERVKKRGYA